jgi:predicted metal-binding membrane protein
MRDELRTMAAARHRSFFLPVLSGLIALTWVALWVWSRSPYGRYLEHGNWFDAGLGALLCRTIPAGEVIVPALIHATGWVMMITAMMLPTTLPLLEQFRRLTAGRADHRVLVALVIAGYLGVWMAFGLVAHGLDLVVLDLFERMPRLALNGWVLGAAVIGTAGLFQFSSLKYRCLDKCRTPLSFVIQHWRGRAPRRNALLLGIHHGAFCVGCCWALMLLMFVVGTGSIGWMLALGAIMAIEKNMPWGRRLSAPLGFALLTWAAVTVVGNVGFFGG